MSDPTRVLIHSNDGEPLAARLAERFPDIQCAVCADYAGLPGQLETYKPQAVYSLKFAGNAGFPRDALFGEHAPRWLANSGVGVDHFGTWDPARTIVTNSAGVASEMMAEYILGGFLHFTLDVPGLKADQTRAHWQADRTVRPLKGQTLVIVGLGHTGRALAVRAKAFGMQVLGTRARPVPMEHVDEVHGAEDLLELLPRADFVAICTPLIPATRGLIGEEAFAAMCGGVIMADVSRGGVMDQTALLAALRSGKVGGAALDVFETEPLAPESPLWSQERLLISPHCSAVHAGWEAASFELFLDNLARFQAGEPLVNVVDPGRGY